MKTLIVECKFTIEVPWKEEWGDDEHARFRIEENSCPGTGPVDGVLSELIKVADENSICWACTLGGDNKLLAIEDREPRNYVDHITFKNEPLKDKTCFCGGQLIGSAKSNASITEIHTRCEKCGATRYSTSMYEGREERPGE